MKTTITKQLENLITIASLNVKIEEDQKVKDFDSIMLIAKTVDEINNIYKTYPTVVRYFLHLKYGVIDYTPNSPLSMSLITKAFKKLNYELH